MQHRLRLVVRRVSDGHITESKVFRRLSQEIVPNSSCCRFETSTSFAPPFFRPCLVFKVSDSMPFCQVPNERRVGLRLFASQTVIDVSDRQGIGPVSDGLHEPVKQCRAVGAAGHRKKNTVREEFCPIGKHIRQFSRYSGFCPLGIAFSCKRRIMRQEF